MSRLRINKHHLWYPRKHYLEGLDHEFREHQGFQIPSLVTWHNLLHDNMDTPPHPTPRMMGDCLDYVGEFNPELGRLSTMHLAMDFFKQPDYHHRSTNDAMLAAEIYEHLSEQLGYIGQMGSVKVEYVDTIRY